MDDDTQGLPVEDTGQGDEPGPEPEGEPQETGDDGAQGEREPETVAQPEPLVATPTPLTQEQLLQQAEERAFQRTASWMGRREQTNLDNIMRNVVQAIDSRLSKFSPTAPLPQVDKGYDPDAFVENPEPMLRSLVPKIMSEVVSRQAETEKRYNVELVRRAGLLMNSDPAFQGEEGKKLGAEVVKEVLSNSGSVDKRLSPDISAKLLVSNAVLNITRKRITAKTNALAGNVSGKVLGTITAPARQVDKPQLVKLDPMTKRIAALFGNTAEEASNMLR